MELFPVIDELSPVAAYMGNEMRINASSDFVSNLRRLNASTDNIHSGRMNKTDIIYELIKLLKLNPWIISLIQKDLPAIQRELKQAISNSYNLNQVVALYLWAQKVRAGGDWDHKPIIKKMFMSKRTGASFQWERYGDKEYNYDIWSNVHYGYVGMAAGFSSRVLSAGAGLAQIKDNWNNSSGIKSVLSCLRNGPAACDDADDQAAIKLGIDLYRSHPKGPLPGNMLVNLITNAIGLKWRYVPLHDSVEYKSPWDNSRPDR